MTEQTSFPLAEKRRILLVEDEEINQEILSLLLEDSYELTVAATGAEAMEAVQERCDTLSLILLDLHLPDTYGLDLLRAFKADVRTARIPVIVMTADSEAEVESLTLGAIDFIPKPYPQPKVILARILRTIELSEDRDTLRWTERDQLTGLYNKEFFYRYCAQMDLYYKRSPMDAVVLDINHFHTINDRYGRSRGDEVLRRVAEKALEVVAESGGIASRSAADSFLLYCPAREDYTAVLDKLSVRLDSEGDSDNRIRLRIGVYSDVDKSLDIERRFDRAKLAADAVRGSFARPIGFYDHSMREKELLCEQLIEDFPAAIREGQFRVYYQPKFDIRPDEPVLCSAEALVRWQHPTLGFVSPGVFIPLFETNGLIQALDYHVWSVAAAQIRDWKARLGVSVPVSVNVSRVDLYDPALINKLNALVEDNGLSHSELLLEITESAYTEDADQIVQTVKTLRSMGFRIEMDDFGSGYSSLSMFSSLPIDALKLDMQFIRSAFQERKDTRLLETMIQLAISFDVPTIAEGVETAEQLFTLKAMGCDIIQGFYFSRPLPADEFEHFVREKRQQPPLEVHSHRTRRDRFTYDALHDPVTGLYNNSAFEILFHDADHEHIAVLLAEVADCEALLRERGRDGTDRAICHVAEVLRESFRSVDHICRLREDEFVIIMTRLTSARRELVQRKLDDVARQLASPADGSEPVRLRVGVAFSDRESPAGDVFQDADAALQRLKADGRSGYLVF